MIAACGILAGKACHVEEKIIGCVCRPHGVQGDDAWRGDFVLIKIPLCAPLFLVLRFFL